MVLNIAIVDDVPADANNLQEQIRSFFREHSPDCVLNLMHYPSGEDFLADPKSANCFLVFLDIVMGDVSGLDVARRIRSRSISSLIVFCSGMREYVWESLLFHPFDFLCKPGSRERVHHVLEEALRTLPQSMRTVEVRIAYGSIHIVTSNIRYVMSENHALEIGLVTGEKIKSIMTFAQLSELLQDEKRFLLCNRGILVNMDEIIGFSGDCFLMRDNTRIPVRQRNRSALLRQYNSYQLSRI